MAEISAALVKQLRDKTGAGMMDAKKALVENNGDIEAAGDWLREKGILKAAKKADRIAAEGLVGLASSGTSAALVEVNSETDFVGKNAEFQAAVREVAGAALANGGDAAKALHATSSQGNTIGEVLVALESTGDKSRLTDLGRKVAMHVASAKPLAATTAELDPAVVEKEKQILTAQASESGKPANVIEKMVEGRIRKFYQESVLVEQAFVMDPDVTVGGFIEKHAQEFGTPVKLKGFIRYEVGEGIEKATSDFAAEVASFAKPKA
jgi:elongation factor Ts